MAHQLKDNLLRAYPNVPPHFDPHIVTPGLDETMYELAQAVPEFGFWEDTFEDNNGKIYPLIVEPTKRAIEQILGVFYTDIAKKEACSERQIVRNIAIMIQSIQSRIAQINESDILQTLRLEHDMREAERVNAERSAVQSGENRLTYLPRLAHKSFIASTDQDFKFSTANFAKIVQARMSDPTNRFVVRDESIAQSPDTMHDLVLDPLQITDRQVENLGFDAPWLSRKRVSRIERVEYKASIISRIKEELQVLRRLGRQFPERNQDHFGKHRIYASRDGYVIGTTNLNSEKPTLYKATLEDALARTEHVSTGTSRESRTLNQLIATLLSFDKELSKSWQQVKDEGDLEVAKNLVTTEIDGAKLKKARNKDKKEARELLEQAMDLDSTYTREVKRGGKVVKEVKIQIPRTAKRAQLRAAISRVQNRLAGGGRRIPRYNANDRTILEEELGRNEAVPFAALLAHLEDRDKGRNPLMDSRRLRPEQRTKVVQSLREWQAHFDAESRRGPLVEPYQSFANAVSAELWKALLVVANPTSRMSALKDSLDSLRGHLLLHRTWKQWAGLYKTHLGNDRMPFFHRFIADLGQLIGSLPKTHSEEAREPTNAALQAYREQAGEMIVTCRHGIEVLAQPGGKVLADKMRRDLKKQMRQVDIIKILTRPEPPASDSMADEPPISIVPPTLPSARDGGISEQIAPADKPEDDKSG